MTFSKSYLAGLFDGEGCIFIARRNVNGKYILRFPHYIITTSINMVHRPLIELLAEQLNGHVLVHKKDLKNPKHRRSYEVAFSSDRARDFLASIYDELVVKKEEARLAIMFQNHLNEFRGRLSQMTIEQAQPILAWRESIRLRVKELKRSSFLDASDWNAGEFGGHPMPDLFEDAEGQYRAKQGLAIPGVCNEHVPAPKGKICSALSGDTENVTETITSHNPNLRIVK